jgi:hypothetical protein
MAATRDLLAAELSRLRWRPISRALGIVAVLAVTAAAVVAFFKTSAEHPLEFADVRLAVADATALFALAGYVLGASLLGADIPTRAFATLLTWEPRRSRVLAARAAVCACLVAGAAFALSMLLAAALLPATRTEAAGLTRAWLTSLTALAARGSLAGGRDLSHRHGRRRDRQEHRRRVRRSCRLPLPHRTGLGVAGSGGLALDVRRQRRDLGQRQRHPPRWTFDASGRAHPRRLDLLRRRPRRTRHRTSGRPLIRVCPGGVLSPHAGPQRAGEDRIMGIHARSRAQFRFGGASHRPGSTAARRPP